MKNMTLENIAAACGGEIYCMREELAQETAKGIVIDSRQIERTNRTGRTYYWQNCFIR